MRWVERNVSHSKPGCVTDRISGMEMIYLYEILTVRFVYRNDIVRIFGFGYLRRRKMKLITVVILTLSVTSGAFAGGGPLFPDGVNQILGRIQPDMSEAQVEEIVKIYYPDVSHTVSIWSGQTGYADFRLTSRYSISVAEYNDPEDFNCRFVHADMILYVYDWELNQRINISFYNWDDETTDD